VSDVDNFLLVVKHSLLKLLHVGCKILAAV